MADKLSATARSENMRRIGSRDTKPELLVRRLLHSLGYRYRIHRRDLPGKPDVVFARRKKIVFVHGCFWHGHNADGCPDRRPIKSNTSYWNPKIEGNVARDQRQFSALAEAGWDVAVIWECETRDTSRLRATLTSFLGPTRFP